MTYPLSAAFDLLSSEYGWTDGQILDMPIRRFWRAVDMANQRIQREKEFQLLAHEAVAKSIISALAGLAQSRKGSKAITKYAAKLSFLPRRERQRELPSTRDIERLFGGRGNR